MANEDWNLGAMMMMMDGEGGDDDVDDEDYYDHDDDVDERHGLVRGRGVLARSRAGLKSATGRVIADLFRVLAPSVQASPGPRDRPSTSPASSASSSASCSSERELMRLLRGLRDEGLHPTVLRSKDVYGYSVTNTHRTPPPSVASSPASVSSLSSSSSSSNSSVTSAGSLDPGHHFGGGGSAPLRRRRRRGKRRQSLKALVERGGRVSLLGSDGQTGRVRKRRPPRRPSSSTSGDASAKKGRRELANRRDRNDEPWRSVSVTVGDSSSDEGVAIARMQAQHQLRVNLSPVIRLQPLPVSVDESGRLCGVRR
ncbi:unnamed protein product [Lampetra fluviatilis]